MPERTKMPEIRFKGFTDEWEKRKICELFDRVIRKNTNNESALPLTISAQDGLVDQITFFNNRVASRDVSSYYLVLNGEFAYNKSTSDGYPFGAVKRLDKYEKGVLSTLYIVLAIKDSKKMSSDFLVYFFETDRWHDGVAERAAEGARNHGLLNITAKDFFDIDLFIPIDKSEQTLIGACLRHLDNIITLQQQKHDALLSVKKAMLEKMFPKDGADVPEIRFQGFAGTWNKETFSNVFVNLRNNTLSRDELSEEYGCAKNIHYGDVLIKFSECLDVIHEKLPLISNEKIVRKYKTSYLRNGDVIIADTAEDETAGKCCEIICLNKERIISGLHTVPCRPKFSFASGYLGFYMNSYAYHNQLLPLMQGIKVTSISKAALQNTFIYYPNSLAEQQKIGDFFRHLDSLIALQQRKADNLKKVKQACLERMFVQG